MGDVLGNLNPQLLWKHFEEICKIPHPSNLEEKVAAYIIGVAKKNNLESARDEFGNIVIRKPATPGKENIVKVVLQGHLDMVAEKNSDVAHNFEKDPIRPYVDGDWVKATGTTLGSDNGIGVASIMTLLSSTDIPHPALEALFTIDEETGMTGALSLKGGLLEGKILLNLDTEADNELTIGCAGGIDITATGNYTQVRTSNSVAFTISVKGLTGGHSGAEIHLGRGNANKIMNRILLNLSDEYRINIASINGGSLRNAIPRESVATIVVYDVNATKILEKVNTHAQIIKEEYKITIKLLLIKP